jgi:uncharacterized repeat protein (TIGR01451 family)
MSSKSTVSIRSLVSKSLLLLTLSSCSVLLPAQVLEKASKSLAVPSVSGKAADMAKMSATFSRLPLAFEANGGQLDSRVKFVSRGAGYNLFLTGNEAVLSLASDKNGKNGDVVRLKIAGAHSNIPASGLDLLPGKTNYFIGNNPAKWRTNIENFSKVRYAGVYPGIDLLYYGNQQQLEHDFVVAPGADPNKIALKVSGAQKLRVDASGDLVLETKNGELRFKKPLIYQEKNGSRVEIAGGYQLERNRVSFRVGEYDRSKELVIDPVLNYSTYLSAASLVTAKAIAVDSSGNAYITGTVVTAGPFAPKSATACATCGPGGAGDVFVAKLNSSGTTLSFLTFIGGTGSDTANAIAVDTAGNAYITGQTSSTDYPTTTGAFSGHLPISSIQITNVGTTNYASAPTVTISGGAGSGALATSAINTTSKRVTLITITNGGIGYTSAPTVSITGGGGTGATATATFITAAQPEVFVTKLHFDGTTLDYSTYLSGSGTSNVGNGIAVDSNGDIYVSGSTNSADFSFIKGTTSTDVTAPSFGRGIQNTNAGADDIFLVKLHPAGASIADLKYATYLGGAGSDAANAIVAAGIDDVYLTGKTASATFPTTAGAAQTTKGSTQDGFVVHANTKSAPITVASCANTGTVTITAANTFAVNDIVTISGVGMNNNGYDFDGTFTVVTASGTGFTYSDAANCHGNPGSTVGTGSPGTNSAAVLAKAKYATLMGGDGDDEGKAIAVDALGNVYVTGSTLSSNASVPQFPDKTNTIQSGGFAGTEDAFVAKVAAGGASFTYSAYLGGTGSTIGNAIFVNPACNGVNACEAYIAGQTTTQTAAGLFDINALQSTNASPQDGFVARVNGTGTALVYSTFLGGAGTDAITGMAGRFPASAEPEAYVVGTTDGSVSVTSSAFQTTPVTATGSFVAKLQANSNTQPGFTINGTQLTPVPPLPVGTDGTSPTSITYKWTVTNANAASATTVDLPIPNDGSGNDLLTISPAPTFSGTVSGTCSTPRVGSLSGGPGGVTCSLGNITAGGSTVIAVSATPTNAAECTTASCPGAINPIALQGTVASAEKPSASNPASGTLNLPNARIINLTVTGTAISNVTVPAGNIYNQGSDTSLTYDISVKNDSLQGNDATNVVVSSAYPANFVVDNITTPAAGTGCVTGGGVVTCPIASIANGATGHVVFDGHFTQAASNILPNSVTAAGTAGDSTQVFTGTGSTNVVINVDYRAPGADLDVTNNGGFSAAPDPVRAGQPLTFTVNYANNGPLNATNVTITQSFTNPSTAKFTATTMPSFCNQASPGANVVCAIPDAAMIAAVGGTGAAATATVASGNVTAITVVSPGSGYTAVPAVSLIGGGGTGATATAVLAGNTVTSIIVNNQGSGYTTTPAVVISSGAGGASATAAIDVNGTVTSVTVNSPGAGYTTPIITLLDLSGGGGTGATASAAVDANGSITGITVDTVGFGYTSAPTVIISGPQSFTISGLAPLDATQAFVNLGSTVAITTTGGTTDTPSLNSSATLSPGPVIRHENQLSVSGFSAPSTVSNSSPGFNYTFTVANAGFDPADNTHVILSLPQNTKPVSSSPGGACGGTLTAPDCNIGTVPIGGAGTAIPVTVSVTPPSLLAAVNQGPNYLGSITSIASADAINVCGGCVTTAGPLTTNVQRQTTLTLSSFVETNPAVGTGATATATVAAGGVTAVNVTAPGTGYSVAPSVALVGGGGTGATATATVAAGAVTAINVTSPGTGYTTPPTVFIAAAVASTGSITYQATVNNAGVDPATNVVLGLNLPTGYALVGSVTQVSGSVTLTCTGTAPLNCTIPTIAATGGSQQVNVTITPAAVSTPTIATAVLNASAQLDLSLSTSDFDSSGTITLTSSTVNTIEERRADLHMVSANATAAVSSDGNITHTITVSSSGSTATNVSVLLTFDHNYRFQSSNSVSGLGAPVCNVTFTATTRACTLPNLPTGTTYIFNVIVQPESGIVQTNSPGQNKTNVSLLSATISAAVIEPTPDTTNPDTTTSAAVTEVRQQANLVASGGTNGLTQSSATVTSGVPVTYTLTVANDNTGGLGPDADVGATVTFTFSANAHNFTNFDGSQSGAIGTGLGTCTPNAAAGTVSCVVANQATPLQSGAQRTGKITFTPPLLIGGALSAQYTGSAVIQSPMAYDNGTNGAAGSDNTSNTVTSTVQTQSDVKITSVVATSPTLASPIQAGANIGDGDPLQYTIKFTNVGDDAGSLTHPVKLTHTLPDETISLVHYGYKVNSVTWSSSIPGNIGSCTVNGGNVFPAGPAAVVVCQSATGIIQGGEVITITETGVANIAPTQNPPSFAFTDSVTIPVDVLGWNDPTSSNNSGNAQAFNVVRTADLGVVQSGGIVVRPILTATSLPDVAGTNFVVTKHNAIQYDITVQNLSLGSAVSNVVVDSVLPSTPSTSALTFTSGTNCSVLLAGPPQTIHCTVPGSLGPVGSGTDMATVSFVLTPNATLPLAGSPTVSLSFNPAVSASGNTDTNPANNSNIPAQITVQRDSDISVAIVGPAVPVTVTSPAPGVTPTFNYIITASNSGPSVATGIRVQDQLPSASDLQFVSASWPTVGSTTSGTCAVGIGTNVNCDLGKMDVGASVPITFTVRPVLSVLVANKLGISNPVTISSPDVSETTNVAPDADSWPVDLRGQADLSVAITPTPVPQPGAHTNISGNGTASHVLVGDRVSYDVQITNNGPYPAGSQITLTDTIDARVNLISAADAGGTGFTCVAATCSASSLQVGGVAHVAIVTDVPPSAVPAGQKTTLTNSAVVTQYTNGTNVVNDITDNAHANNTASTPTIIADAAEDLVISQTAPPTALTPAAGGPANSAAFTVKVTNNNDVPSGRSAATNVQVVNAVTISPNNSVTSITAPAGCVVTAVTLLNASSDKATVTCTLAGSIASGASSSFTFSMTPTKPGTISNSPTVTSTTATNVTNVEVDPDTSNNTLSAAAIAASTITVNNTPPGPQTVNPVDPISGIPNTNVSIFFPNVTISGSSFVTVTSTPANGSLASTLVPTTTYYNLASAAVSTTPLKICVNYTGTSFLNSERVRLYSVNTGSDITSSLDQVANIVCGNFNNNLTTSLTGSTANSFAVSEPKNTPPQLKPGQTILASASPSQQSSGKGVTGTSVTLSSNIIDNDIGQGCFTPKGSTAANGAANSCSDVLTFTWTGQFVDGTVKVFTCTSPYTAAGSCKTPDGSVLNGENLDVSVTTTAQTLHLTVSDQTNDPATGVLGPIAVPLSQTGTSTAGTATVTVNKGQTGTFNVLTVDYTGTTPLNLSFTGAPSLSASQITCSASPATLSGPVTGQSVTVLCSTQGQVFAMSAPPRNMNRGDAPMVATMVGFSGLPLVGLLLLPGKSRRKKMLKIWAMFGLLLLMVAFQASCGGGGGGSFGGAPVLQNAGTPAGTYTVTVNSATGLTAHYGATPNATPATSLTLVVQ